MIWIHIYGPFVLKIANSIFWIDTNHGQGFTVYGKADLVRQMKHHRSASMYILYEHLFVFQ